MFADRDLRCYTVMRITREETTETPFGEGPQRKEMEFEIV